MSYSGYHDNMLDSEDEDRSISEIIIENSGLLREIQELKTKIQNLEEQIDELNEHLEYR